MNKKEIEEVKKQMVANLKESIENSLLENFVEKYEDWQEKMKSVNNVISHVDSQIPLYAYDEFCKKIIEITKNCLETVVDYDKLFLTSSEYLKIVNENAHDERKMEQALLDKLNKKYTDNLMLILTKDHLKESVRYKLKEKFSYVEDELEKSLQIAREILKDHDKREK